MRSETIVMIVVSAMLALPFLRLMPTPAVGNVPTVHTPSH